MDPIVNIGLFILLFALGFVLGYLRSKDNKTSLLVIAKFIEGLAGFLPLDQFLVELADKLSAQDQKLAIEDLEAIDMVIERVKAAINDGVPPALDDLVLEPREQL
jgi:hypothetical protein